MKKVLMLVLGVVLFVGVASANMLGRMADYNVSNDWEIKNVDLTTAESFYTITLDAGSVVDFTIVAASREVRWYKTAVTAEAYLPIPDGSSFWPSVPAPLPKNTVLQFLSTESNGKVAVLYFYR